MSEGKPSVSSSGGGGGIGLLGVMLVLAYSPLNWNFPLWLWGLAAFLPIIMFGFVSLVGALAIARRK